MRLTARSGQGGQDTLEASQTERIPRVFSQRNWESR